MNALRAALIEAQKDQVATQSRLADFPRFRAVSNATLPLSEVQNQLRDGEGYYKMTVVGDRVYALLATPKSARAVRIDAIRQGPGRRGRFAARDDLDGRGREKDRPIAFDVGLARKLYVQLFQPFDADLAGVRQLIFEPDGAMLRLPPNLLIASDAGIDAYRKRAADRRPTLPNSTSPGCSGSAAIATSPLRFRRAPSATCARRRRPPLRANISASATMRRQPARAAADRPRLLASAERPGRTRSRPRSCRSRATRSPRATRCAPRSSPERRSPTMPSRPARPRPVSRDPLRDPRHRHPAAGQVPGPARAADQLRRRRAPTGC